MSILMEALDQVRPALLVRERAFDAVRDAIVSGRLAPGTRLIERELCEALGISRPSVREMIRRLEAERLVTIAPHRGPAVARLTAKEAGEIYEIRGFLEALLIGRFTEVASESEVKGLAAIFAEVETRAKTGDRHGIVGLMLRFNDHLLAVVDHAVARDLLGQLNARINLLRIRAMEKPGRLDESLDEFRAILAAVRRRDAAKASRLMAASVEKARQAALEQLDGSESPGRKARAGARRMSEAGSS